MCIRDSFKEVQQLHTEKERVHLLGEEKCQVCTVTALNGLIGFMIESHGLQTYVFASDETSYDKFIEHVRRQA